MSRPHGTYAKYRKEGCRCEPCTRANARASKVYRLRTGADRNGIPAVPMSVPGDRIRRHLAALVASGWTRADIAAETGITTNRVGELARGYRSAWVQVGTADRILTLAPFAPDDGIDDVMVLRLIEGFPTASWRDLGATRAERLEAFRRMDFRDRRATFRTQGYADTQIELPSAERVRAYLGLRTSDVKRPELEAAS